MTVTIKGREVQYTMEGQGAPVLILEGWGTNTQVYSSISHLLSSKYTVYTLDFPGFGKSPEPDTVWDVGAYAEFTRAFIEHFSFENYTLIGHSFGGRVIFKLFEEGTPKGLSRIILIDSAGVKPADTFKKKVRRIKYKFGRRMLELFAPAKVEKYRLKHSSADYKAASPMMREVLKKTVSEDLSHLFSKVNVPTLLIWGKNDTATPLSDAKLMEKTIPDAGLVELEGGHYSFLDQPVIFSRVMASFMKL
ncbi:MAG: alpha/beta hydrolase [Clostridia bacterium]|nr:alpha/beta hydrolase [Clostridia bacterium]